MTWTWLPGDSSSSNKVTQSPGFQIWLEPQFCFFLFCFFEAFTEKRGTEGFYYRVIDPASNSASLKSLWDWLGFNRINSCNFYCFFLQKSWYIKGTGPLVRGDSGSPGVELPWQDACTSEHAGLHAASLSLIRHLPSCGLDLMESFHFKVCVSAHAFCACVCTSM